MLRRRAEALSAVLLATALLLASCTTGPADSATSASTIGSLTAVTSGSTGTPPSRTTDSDSVPGTSASLTESAPIVGSSSPPLAQCASESRATATPGVLTLAAPDDAGPPWYVDRDPSSGNGFEAAVGYALAGRLGFASDRVQWVTVDRQVLAGGDGSGYDLAAAELISPDLPDGSMDYSTGYLDAGDALAVADQALSATAANLETVSALRIGVVEELSAASELQTFVPAADPQVFATADELLAALTAGAVDVAAVNLIDALDAGAFIIGTFPIAQGQPRQLSFALPPGSPWTGCVSSVLDSMRADGTLESLTASWIGPLPELSR